MDPTKRQTKNQSKKTKNKKTPAKSVVEQAFDDFGAGRKTMAEILTIPEVAAEMAEMLAFSKAFKEARIVCECLRCEKPMTLAEIDAIPPEEYAEDEEKKYTCEACRHKEE